MTVGEKKAIAEAMMAVKEDFNVKNVNKDYTKFDVLSGESGCETLERSWTLFYYPPGLEADPPF